MRSNLTRRALAQVVLGLTMLTCLAGCGQDQADARLIDYQEQLATALDQAAPTPLPPDNIGAFPDADQRLFTIPETREGMLDVFALRDCHIANLVAGRNNQLGRVAPPSQRWLYELNLWRRLSGCWNTEVPARLSDDHRERLARLTLTKTEQLPRVSWNALFASREWVGNFSRASSPLSPEELAAVVEAPLGALAYLRAATLHQFDRGWSPDSATLEGHLKTLQERPLSAELLRTLMLAERRLVEASRLLESALAASTCADATRVGPPAWLEPLETASRRWLTAIDRLLEVHVDPPPAIADYRRRWLSLEAQGAPYPAFQAAREHHEALRSTLDRRCG